MSGAMTRRTAIAGLLAGLGGAAVAEAPLSSPFPLARPPEIPLRPVRSVATEAMVRSSGLTGDIAFAVANARTGELLEVRNPGQQLAPASVAKILTGAYAIDALGLQSRFSTTLRGGLPGADGTIDGDLRLIGGGDPVLTTDHLAAMADALAESGARRITGRLIADGSRLPFAEEIEPGQPDHLGYNPSVGGLNLNFNRVHFEWTRTGAGYTVTMQARDRANRPDAVVARMTIEDRGAPVYTYGRGDDGADAWTVARSALGDGGARWLPVRQPARYAGEVFRALAAARGVALPPAEVALDPAEGGLATAPLLASHDSAPVETILRNMLKYSTNLTAEVIGLDASRSLSGRPSSLLGSAAAMNRWTRTSLGASSVLVDHSGLGDRSRISPADLVAALSAIGPESPLRGLMKEVAVVNGDGAAVPSDRIGVRAKTGTLFFVSALAGFIKAEDGSDLAFAILAADSELRAQALRSGEERPRGTRGWSNRARSLQRALLYRWGVLGTA